MSRTQSSFSTDEVGHLLRENFTFSPTPSQDRLIRALSAFIISEKPNCTLILKGYAGTGKTTMVNTLVKTLPRLRQKAVLLAPTGRAAKVLSQYTRQTALTIHKKIYFVNKTADGKPYFARAQNLHKNTIFVVDEASMISWDQAGGRNLLADLVEYVFSGHNCRLILIGDDAQLPPVRQKLSPALDFEFLRTQFDLTLGTTQLTEVVRQEGLSGILEFATHLRQLAKTENPPVVATPLPQKPDIIAVNGSELHELMETAYDSAGSENVIFITRSNKRANLFNQQVRARIFFYEEPVSAGDLMMVVKNNYFWLQDSTAIGFVANGDIFEVVKCLRIQEQYGFTFADALIRFIDYPSEPELEVKLLLNTTTSNEAALSEGEMEQLYTAVAEDYQHLKTKKARQEALQKDVWLNALQVKFAYAVTCHKAQGGQWPVVFVEQGYITEEIVDQNFYRWFYTAVSRATTTLYLVNFSDMLVE